MSDFDACRKELAELFIELNQKYSTDVFMPALAMNFGNGLRSVRDLGRKAEACHLLRLTRRHAGLPWWRT